MVQKPLQFTHPRRNRAMESGTNNMPMKVNHSSTIGGFDAGNTMQNIIVSCMNRAMEFGVNNRPMKVNHSTTIGGFNAGNTMQNIIVSCMNIAMESGAYIRPMKINHSATTGGFDTGNTIQNIIVRINLLKDPSTIAVLPISGELFEKASFTAYLISRSSHHMIGTKMLWAISRVLKKLIFRIPPQKRRCPWCSCLKRRNMRVAIWDEQAKSFRAELTAESGHSSVVACTVTKLVESDHKKRPKTGVGNL
ncbi:unnamed protein product [Cochlearia groenlandica]